MTCELGLLPADVAEREQLPQRALDLSVFDPRSESLRAARRVGVGAFGLARKDADAMIAALP